MEIIHIILGKANPDRMNGVNKVVFALATKQALFGENVCVWGIAKDKIKNYPERNFNTKLFLKSRNPFGISSELKNAILEKKDKAIFHFHGGWIPVYYTLSKFLHNNSIPFIITPHGAYNTIAMKKSKWVKKIYYHLFEKDMLTKASKIHCLGQSEMEGLSMLYSSTKAILLPYGFENTSKVTEFENKDHGQFVFGFIGRLDVYTKGIDALIEGFSEFIKRNPNARLWIIGDSNEKDLLKKLVAERGISNQVVFFGSKFGKHKEILLKNFDVFVHPSRNEGLPVSVIEAASFGKPCIVSTATNMGDLVQNYDAGKMIDTVSAQKITQAMDELYLLSKNQEQFKSIGKNAMRMIKENFNWEKIINDYNLYLYQ